MLNMRKLSYTLILLAIFLTLTPSRVLACRGVTHSFWDAYTSASTVFTGKLIRMETNGNLIVTFQVLKTWKGPHDETLVVTTARNPISCGMPFSEFDSDTFLVYAYGDADQLSTHIFSRTMPLSEAGADIIKLSIVTNLGLILLTFVVIGLVIMGIRRYFLRKRQTRALAEDQFPRFNQTQ